MEGVPAPAGTSIPMDSSKGIALYTDGSASHVDRSGGWAFVALDAFESHDEASGGASDTTISRMELQAVLEGLKWTQRAFGPSEVLVHSDSLYVVLGCQDRSRKRKKNVDLWTRLDEAVDSHEYVEFEHVRGHQGDCYNEMADDLAGRARKGEAPGDKIQKKFLEFHEANPDVYEDLVALCREAKEVGKDKVGISLLWERMRWSRFINTESSDEYKLNNNWRSRYARLIIDQEEDLRDMFEIRKLQSE